ncbi:hypothetical protein BO221_13160 [Archangium sp. Cb G35]|uniref:hypothetical protein n=1 Tax=Archangium sp. Cb G35 TaxID=1920190 RepID=UPI000935C350|nr:hypothetical protein [Archangium sp. Cb G35]OJT24134.1 hypothetical protein BO221_13160 [Archangium sp. Cb G35]
MNPASASPLPLLLILLLISPGVGFAQEAPPASPDDPTVQPEHSTDAPLPGSGERSPPRLMEEPQRPYQGVRILAEFGGGVLLGATGLVLGYFPTLFSNAEALPMLVLTGTGIALGTYWGGQLLKGQASLRGTVVGMLLGGAAGMLLSVAAGAPPTSVLSIYFAPPLMLLGAIIGYESTEKGDPPTRVQPVVSLTPRGASLGLAGTF